MRGEVFYRIFDILRKLLGRVRRRKTNVGWVYMSVVPLMGWAKQRRSVL